jgi:hypothetical protein
MQAVNQENSYKALPVMIFLTSIATALTVA